MRKYRNYTDDNIKTGASQVKSLAGLLRALGIKAIGGNYANMKRHLQRLNVDCSHWTGQAWNAKERLKDWSDYCSYKSIKKHLIKLRNESCEICKLKEWLGKTFVFEVHHIDGDRTNNELNNLQILCPNCHSFTDNFRNKKINKLSKEEMREREKESARDKCSCGNVKRKTSKVCRKCSDIINKRNTKSKSPTKEKLHWLAWNFPIKEISNKLKISANSIRKYYKKFLIINPPRGYWPKYKKGLIIDYSI